MSAVNDINLVNKVKNETKNLSSCFLLCILYLRTSNRLIFWKLGSSFWGFTVPHRIVLSYKLCINFFAFIESEDQLQVILDDIQISFLGKQVEHDKCLWKEDWTVVFEQYVTTWKRPKRNEEHNFCRLKWTLG